MTGAAEVKREEKGVRWRSHSSSSCSCSCSAGLFLLFECVVGFDEQAIGEFEHALAAAIVHGFEVLLSQFCERWQRLIDGEQPLRVLTVGLDRGRGLALEHRQRLHINAARTAGRRFG
jgi:hypothetical protein